MPVGRTKDAGWQIGVSMTVAGPVAPVWDRLVSASGVAVWLGPDAELLGEPGESYETAEGVTGEVRSFRPGDRIRLTWQPADWDHETEREAQRSHWKQVAERLRPILEAPTEI